MPSSQISIGESFDRYRILAPIASGGMADVYRARYEGLEGFSRLCALKVLKQHLHEQDTQSGRRFVDEARLWGHLNHPNIVNVRELGCHKGRYFIAMELIEGRDLRKLLESIPDHQLPPAVAIYITSEILQALVHAHHATDENGDALDLVHRDISPHNILISNAGEIKLTDFGIAKSHFASQETTQGLLRGKCAYMSPEQIRFEKLDARADLYAVGAVLFEMLCGKKCHAGKSDYETLQYILHGDVVFPHDVPDSIKWLLQKSLAKDVNLRFQSAQNFLTALTEISQIYDLNITRDDLVLFLKDKKNFEPLENCSTKTKLLSATLKIQDEPTVTIATKGISAEDHADEKTRTLDAQLVHQSKPETNHNSRSLYFTIFFTLTTCVLAVSWIWHTGSESQPAQAKELQNLSVTPPPVAVTPPIIMPTKKQDLMHEPPEKKYLPATRIRELAQLIPYHELSDQPVPAIVTPMITLRVNAIPWAYASVNGKKTMTTPFVTQVPVGNTSIVMHHPKSGIKLRKNFTLSKKQTLTCTADFLKKNTLVCF